MPRTATLTTVNALGQFADLYRIYAPDCVFAPDWEDDAMRAYTLAYNIRDTNWLAVCGHGPSTGPNNIAKIGDRVAILGRPSEPPRVFVLLDDLTWHVLYDFFAELSSCFASRAQNLCLATIDACYRVIWGTGAAYSLRYYSDMLRIPLGRERHDAFETAIYNCCDYALGHNHALNAEDMPQPSVAAQPRQVPLPSPIMIAQPGAPAGRRRHIAALRLGAILGEKS